MCPDIMLVIVALFLIYLGYQMIDWGRELAASNRALDIISPGWREEMLSLGVRPQKNSSAVL